MKKPEILAPVGSMAMLYAAIYAGADAVYLGGKQFGARAFADNFDDVQLKRAVLLAHLHQIKVYYTLNTLVKESEIEKLIDECQQAYRAGVDAFIIQDMAVYCLAKQYFPAIEIHASTQMAIHHSEGVLYLEELGFDRIILNREMSLTNIAKIRQKTSVPLEVFVHGALCYCYSGQCQMSSSLGNRSANRGKCAQPCRLMYAVDGQQGHFLSAKDQMTLSHLPALVEIGVESLKIEGRMKSPEYVYLTTSIYRRYRDLAMESVGQANPSLYQIDDADRRLLATVFNRGQFTEGYFQVKEKANQCRQMVSLDFVKHQGVAIGRIETIKGRQISLRFERAVVSGSTIQILVKRADGVVSWSSGLSVNQSVDAGQVKTFVIPAMAMNERLERIVYLVKDGRWQIDLDYLVQEPVKELFFDATLKAVVGQPLCLQLQPVKMTDWPINLSREDLKIEGDIVEQAINQASTVETMTRPLSQTGQTFFSLRQLTIETDGCSFVPVSQLKRLRRRLLQRLEDRLAGRRDDYQMIEKELGRLKLTTAGRTFKISPSVQTSLDKKTIKTVLVRRCDQLALALNYPFDRIYIDWDYFEKDSDYLDKVKSANQTPDKQVLPSIWVASPTIMTEEECRQFEASLKKINYSGYLDGLLVRNPGAIKWLKKIGLPVQLDYSYNVFNRMAYDFYLNELEANRQESESSCLLNGLTLSMELSSNELAEFRDLPFEMVVYGKLPAMITAQRWPDLVSKTDYHYLVDRKQVAWPIHNGQRTVASSIYHPVPICLLDMADLPASCQRVECLDEPLEELAKLFVAFLQDNPYNIAKFTRHHYHKGVT